jgi:ferritin-like metal-binding protein YciE
MAQESLYDLFVANLRRMYDAEQRLVKALPKMRDAAPAEDLKHAFQVHFEETEIHVDRLDQIFELLDTKAKAETCDGIKGVIKDGDDVLELNAEAAVKDAALIAAAQVAEHVEIAFYGTLRTWAAALEKTEAMHILEVTLEDEKNADALLTNIAATLNLRAAHANDR